MLPGFMLTQTRRYQRPAAYVGHGPTDEVKTVRLTEQPKTLSCDPVTVSIATLGLGVVNTIGGFVQGQQRQATNDKLANQQEQGRIAQQQRQEEAAAAAERLVNSINRDAYDQLASRDVSMALKDVTAMAASRGMGYSTAHDTAASNAAGQIRSSYGQKYLQDKNAALVNQANVLAGLSSTNPFESKPLGYSDNPYADFGQGVRSIGNWVTDPTGMAALRPATPSGTTNTGAVTNPIGTYGRGRNPNQRVIE